jgi:hypothetical protein
MYVHTYVRCGEIKYCWKIFCPLVARLSFSTMAAGSEYKWVRYLPVEDDFKTGDLEDYDHVEPATRADPIKVQPDFLQNATEVREIVPEIGTEIRGVQLSELSNYDLDELSLMLGWRKLLVLRGQDFAKQSVERQKEIVSYVPLIEQNRLLLTYGQRHFGRLHVHPISGHVPGSHEHLVFYRTAQGYDTNTHVLSQVIELKIEMSSAPALRRIASRLRSGTTTSPSSAIPLLQPSSQVSPSLSVLAVIRSLCHSPRLITDCLCPSAPIWKPW